MEKDIYRLVGVLDTHEFEDDFLYPIFEKDGDYYFESTFNDTKIKTFERVDGEAHRSRIESLEDYNVINHFKRNYSLGEDAVLVYKENEDNLFIGTIDQFITFYQVRDNNPFTNNVLNSVKEERDRISKK